MTADTIVRLGAGELARAMRERRLSASDAVEASLERIAALDESLQAFVTVAADAARKEAKEADRASAPRGPLHGVPVAVKDNTATRGIRTTHGSCRFREFVPEKDHNCVARLRAAGAIVIGKTNTPEFAFGAVCRNPLRGPTANPWDHERTSGGSSGGSAVAVTTGMVPLAHGTDFGGSVRTPASFCGCVGLRPTPGVIADPDRGLAWNTLSTHGVLARSAGDAALMLSVLAGPDLCDPTSWPAKDEPGQAKASHDASRCAASLDLNGSFRVDEEVATAFESAVASVARVLGPVSREAPDCTGASQAFQTLRAALSWHNFRRLLAAGTNDLTPSFVWNVERGKNLPAQAYLEAEAVRSRAYRSFARFFERFDILILPAASVLPFPNAQEEVTEIAGQPCETIIDYLAPTYLVSLVGFPVLSLPCGLTTDGLPFGVQLVARPYDEARLLAVAERLETAGFRHLWPDLVGVA
ncbi:amidase [Microvirga massiliensis]|uniref:amidase n=1 Tax=Microvirga massiliensis TaxID=1033741 RepID=UPI00062BB0CA|nr:amidase [Microvirga massiliensis]